MAKYRKNPVVVDAVRWSGRPTAGIVEHYRPGDVVTDMGNGRLAYRPYDIWDANRACRECGNPMLGHGFINTLEGGHIVCPGDFIITGVKGEVYPCKPDIFRATYEKVTEAEKKPCASEQQNREDGPRSTPPKEKHATRI